MNNMPQSLRKRLAEDPFYSKCAIENSDCKGRITWEHALYYAGKQVQEWWAIVPLCWHHHLGSGMDKEVNQWIALSRAPIRQMLELYPKAYYEWQQRLKYLNEKYGKYDNKFKGKKQGTIYKSYH